MNPTMGSPLGILPFFMFTQEQNYLRTHLHQSERLLRWLWLMLSRICVNLYTKTPRPSLSWHNLIVCLTSNHNWWNLGWDAFKGPLASVFFKRPGQPPCRLADIEQQRGKGMWRDLLGAIEFLPLAPAAGFSCQLGEELKLNTIKGKRNQSCL